MYVTHFTVDSPVCDSFNYIFEYTLKTYSRKRIEKYLKVKQRTIGQPKSIEINIFGDF